MFLRGYTVFQCKTEIFQRQMCQTRMADKTPEDKTPEDKTPEKSGHWDKNPELIFRGRTEPRSYKYSKCKRNHQNIKQIMKKYILYSLSKVYFKHQKHQHMYNEYLDFWTHHEMRGINSLVFFCRVTAAQDCLLTGNSPLAYYEINFITSATSSCNIHRFDYLK